MQFESCSFGDNQTSGSGRPRIARSEENLEIIEELILRQEEKSGVHFCQRKITKDLGILQSSLSRASKAGLSLKAQR